MERSYPIRIEDSFPETHSRSVAVFKSSFHLRLIGDRKSIVVLSLAFLIVCMDSGPYPRPLVLTLASFSGSFGNDPPNSIGLLSTKVCELFNSGGLHCTFKTRGMIP